MTNTEAPLTARAPSRTRQVTDIILALSALIMLATGFALLGWHEVEGARSGTVLGVGYVAWGEVHLFSSIIFFVAALSHLRLNFRPLIRHFGYRRRG